MSGNRVEELEAKVRELEATIEGLTDELVETKERLGTIEDEAGIEPDVLEGRLTRTRSDSKDETISEDATTTDGDDESSSDGDETTDSGGDDIIVA